MDFSRQETAADVARQGEEQEYADKLRAYNTEQGAYSPMTIDESDNKHLSEIKKQINSIVAQELQLLEYQDTQKQRQLAGAAYKEVITRQNFFFAVDERKRETNLTTYDKRAPGNPAVRPRCILPHEHVSV